jgi:integration host factor subunit beta
MTRADLIADLAASNPHLRGGDLELVVEAVFSQITVALARGQRVELRGFGAFIVKPRKARIGRNPRTGEKVPVNAKTALAFRTGRELQRRLNPRGGSIEPRPP